MGTALWISIDQVGYLIDFKSIYPAVTKSGWPAKYLMPSKILTTAATCMPVEEKGKEMGVRPTALADAAISIGNA
jgi:hypothetical protein